MKLDYKLERLIEKHAERVGITKAEALEIVSLYFSNIRNTIAEGSKEEGFAEIYIPKLGEFKPNYNYIKKYEAIKAGKQQPL